MVLAAEFHNGTITGSSGFLTKEHEQSCDSNGKAATGGAHAAYTELSEAVLRSNDLAEKLGFLNGICNKRVCQFVVSTEPCLWSPLSCRPLL